MSGLKIIEQYLHQVVFPQYATLSEARVYGPNAEPAWALARDVPTTATIDSTTGVMRYDRTQPRSKYKGIDVNLDRVIMRSMSLKYAKNTTLDDYVVRLNYTPAAYREGQSHLDTISQAISPNIPIGFAVINKGVNESRTEIALCENPEIITTQKSFIHTMTLINESNIKNGVIELPREVCLQANLDMTPTVQQADGTRTKFNFYTYYAVPPDHVLAWTLKLTDYQRRRFGVHAVDFIVEETGRFMYYLVGDECLQMLVHDCATNWLNEGAIEVHPLSKFNITFHNTTNNGEGNVELTLNVTFTAFPQNIPQNVLQSLAPTTSPNFPLFIHSKRCRDIMDFDRIEQEKEQLEKEAQKKSQE